ncbi:spore coat associated protein CotJA [Sediminibacillus albus]|uniref:Spore coat protein JA n=1 Tax=Sediminibacillus albus TaxID=407036 RepID=A0A1G8VNE6_9BACI|nr:spore coat associated protein CotJA [Sediminibacillus albus]SDJ66925.1 spore coat protein JA [Sediminibacillus albus]
MFTQRKYYTPYISPYDPCKPIEIKSYDTPPQLYIGMQPPGLPQYATAREALYRGTLWPLLYSPYSSPYERGEDDD